MRALITFFQKKTWIAILLSTIIVAAALLRFWNLPNAVLFLGDQGRDALVVSRIFREGDLVFIGPVTSVGNMYLGPFYYYFMLPFLWLSFPSPLGPVYAVALLGVVTVFLLYFWGRRLIGEKAALLAAGLMAVSTTAIDYSRFSWNPNIAPFVSLAMIYFTYLAWQKRRVWWLAVAVCFAVLIQLHYVTILAGVAAGTIWLWQTWQSRGKRKELSKQLVMATGAIVILLISLVPLLLFDSRHNWLNAKAFSSLLSDDQNFVQQDVQHGLDELLLVVKETHGRSMHMLFEITIGKQRTLNSILVLTVLVILFAYFLRKKQKEDATGLVVIATYLVVGIIGLSFYQHSVFDHYISFLFPVSFLVLGFCLSQLSRLKFLGWPVVMICLLYFGWINYGRLNLEGGGPKLKNLAATADSIHKRVNENQPYAIVLLSESGDLYGMNYRYYLSIDEDKTPVMPENNDQAEKLFIINEDQKSDKPESLPIYEIITFGASESAEVYQLDHRISVTVLSKP